MMRISSLIICFFLCLGALQAQNAQPQSFETIHENTFSGKRMRYKVLAKETILQNAKGEPAASMWSTSYFLMGEPDVRKRPVMFVFNGGPGSASFWLHMGFFGPKVVKVEQEAFNGGAINQPPVVKNEHFLLDIADLVFIDPIGTGFSTVLPAGKEEDYWGLREDAASIAQFIRKWITEHQRWMSPKYVAGESFGTTRAAALAVELAGGGQAVGLNGIIMISQALDYAGSTSAPNNITSFFTYLPTMAATAWYHKKAGTGKTLEAFVEEARQFAYGDYLSALYKDGFMSHAEKEKIAERLSYFTGLSKAYILQSDLKILTGRFRKELLRAEGKTVGTLDSRYTGMEADQISDRATMGDPSSYLTSPGYTAAFNDYLNELNVKMDRPYLSSNRQIGGRWRWFYGGEPNYVNTAPDMSNAMRTNPQLKVMIASGYYDLITPFFDAEYTFSRHGIVLDRVWFTYYEGGHMMYNNEKEFKQLADDIRKFITGK
jgi:carboxypeptidase C (cathepsin A)